MNSRRTFIEKLGKGASFSAITISTPALVTSQWMSKSNIKTTDTFKIGIIGAENSHTAGFGKLFNEDKSYTGMEVKYVWGETDKLAKKAMVSGSIPNQVTDPNEMLGKIDGLIVDHRHGKFHLEPAIPFIKTGIPTFIDKPFCYRAKEGKEFLALARKHGTPVTSFSSIAHSYETFEIGQKIKTMGTIAQVVRYGPVDLNSEYWGVFFYGPHIVQPLLYLFGTTVEKVRVQNNGKSSSAGMVFKDGMMATLIFTSKKYGWQTHIETENGIIELQAEVEAIKPGKNYDDMVKMFRTGEEPRSHQSIIHGVAVLEALEKSISSDQWEKVTQFEDI